MALEKWVVLPGESRIIDVELVRKLKVGLIGGKIDILGHDEESARIEVHSVTGKDLKITIDGDVLEIDHPQLGGRTSSTSSSRSARTPPRRRSASSCLAPSH
jgi:hypothetical protein